MSDFTGGWVVFAYSLVYGFVILYAISLLIRFRSIRKRYKGDN